MIGRLLPPPIFRLSALSLTSAEFASPLRTFPYLLLDLTFPIFFSTFLSFLLQQRIDRFPISHFALTHTDTWRAERMPGVRFALFLCAPPSLPATSSNLPNNAPPISFLKYAGHIEHTRPTAIPIVLSAQTRNTNARDAVTPPALPHKRVDTHKNRSSPINFLQRKFVPFPLPNIFSFSS